MFLSLPPRRARPGVVVSALLAVVALTACVPRNRGGAPTAAPRPVGSTPGSPAPPDPVQVYRGLGLIAHGGPLPITGRLSYIGSASPDTTFTVLTLALPNRALSFTHAGEEYRASYRVEMDVAHAGAPRTTPLVAQHVGQETVRVATFRETTRTDESVIFQQVLRLPPGAYQLALRVRDGGSDRVVEDTSTLQVPRLGDGTLSTPQPYYEAVVRPEIAAVPRVLVMPRATVTFGHDSLLPLYLEAYGEAVGGGATSVIAAARGEGGAVLWRDTILLQPRTTRLASGVVNVPVSSLGIGPATLAVWRADAPANVPTDTARAPVFVSFGDDLPVASFEDMLSYLRFFAAPQTLEALRKTPLAGRAAAWRAFLARTDPDPLAPGNQALYAYFTRLQVANQRYRDEAGPGWLSDRGMVYMAYGDPEQVFESSPVSVGQRNRVQIWVYRSQQLQLEFRDMSGFDRWELTPQAQSMFMTSLRRLP